MKMLQELFTKYLNDQCSPEEVKQLLALFNVHNEEALKKLIGENLKSTAAQEEESQWNKADMDDSLAAIKERMKPAKLRSVSIYHQPWFRIAAAAVVVAGAFTVYQLAKNDDNQPAVAVVATPEKQTPPWSNKATLTLADGTAIVLQDVAKGEVADQGETRIKKAKDGQITYTSINEKPGKELLNNLRTPKGGEYQVTLSDGSNVWLNAASTLYFPAQFIGSERRVMLDGEAYFEVTKNAAAPFIVSISGKGAVEVLGTHFNVSAYPEDGVVKTTLLEGKVKIIAGVTNQSTILNSGEESLVSGNGEITVDKNADTEQAVAWKKGVFSFDHTDLRLVLRQLARWYDIDIKFEGPVPSRKFSGEIQRDLKLPQVLKILKRNEISTRIEGRTLVILK